MSRGTGSGRRLAAIGGARHRDRLVPVVDGRRRLGAGTAGPPPWLCVFVRMALGVVAVLVDAVLGFDRAADGGPDGAPCVDLAAIGTTKGAEDGPRAAD